MKGKQWLALLLAALLLLGLGACGGEEEAPDAGQSSGGEQPSYLEGSANVCLFENESCAFTLTSTGTDAWGDYCWNVAMTNKTGRELVFTMDDVSVNGYEADPYWADDVGASQSAPSVVSWFQSTFDDCGIQSVKRVDFQLTVYPAGESENVLAGTGITLYPDGKAAFEDTSRQLQESDTILADTEELQIIATGCKADESGGFTVSLYLENRTENDYSLTLENVKVNGQRCDPLWTRELVGGRRSFSDVSWFGADLESMEIYTVTRVEFDLVAADISTGSSILEQHCVIEP